MESAGLSLTDPAGLLPSSFPKSTLPLGPVISAAILCNLIKGVLPMASSSVK
jgi:hypothetical protein